MSLTPAGSEFLLPKPAAKTAVGLSSSLPTVDGGRFAGLINRSSATTDHGLSEQSSLQTLPLTGEILPSEALNSAEVLRQIRAAGELSGFALAQPGLAEWQDATVFTDGSELEGTVNEDETNLLLFPDLGMLPLYPGVTASEPTIRSWSGQSGSAIASALPPAAMATSVDASGIAGSDLDSSELAKTRVMAVNAGASNDIDLADVMGAEVANDTLAAAAEKPTLSAALSNSQAPSSSAGAMASWATDAMSSSVDSGSGEALDIGLSADQTLLEGDRSSPEALEFGSDRQRWSGALGGRLLTMIAADIQEARIHLDPPELGALEIKMTVDADDQARVSVQVQNSQVKEVLESQAQRLREALAEQGLTLAGFDVSEQSPGQGFSGRDDAEAENTLASDLLDDDDNLTADMAEPHANLETDGLHLLSTYA
jgi:hypothetical protein